MKLLLFMVVVLATIIGGSVSVGLRQDNLAHDAMRDRTDHTLQGMRNRISALRAETGPTSAALHRVADYLEGAHFRGIDRPISEADMLAYAERYIEPNQFATTSTRAKFSSSIDRVAVPLGQQMLD